MKKGKLIVVEGTDCSGKETQVKRAVARFKEMGLNIYNYSFPMYDTPTGRIVGGPYLGKSYICEGWFPEGATNVDALAASAYYAADRRYNIGIINKHLENGDIVILDRYVESNMAHQGGKLKTPEERTKMYQKLDTLEFEIMELPRPDAVIFLYMPFEYAAVLKKNREETPDQHESNKAHLKQAETAYLELTEKYGYTTPMLVPKIDKIVVNMGVGDATVNSKNLDNAVRELEKITGLKAVETTAKKSIASFKVREGHKIGCKVTLRGDRMYNFLDKLISISLPRVRDFRGLSPKSFDGRGNYTIGIKEQIIFPEINFDEVEKVRGMDIVIVTTANTNEEAFDLLKELGVPFRK